MTNEQLLEIFNPANAGNLSAEQTEILHNLSDDQIDALADAYPNQPTRKSYLRLYDKNLPANKQVYQLSTWQNLRNVRKYSNLKNLIPWDFLTSATRFNQPQPAARVGSKVVAPKKVFVDLTAEEAAAELRRNIVDKPPAEDVKVAATKTSKTATNPRKGKGKTKNLAESQPVNNESLPADQDFGDGQ